MSIMRQFGPRPTQSMHKPVAGEGSNSLPHEKRKLLDIREEMNTIPPPPKMKKKTARNNGKTTMINIRLNNEVLAELKKEAGWQTRVNRILGEALGIRVG